MIRTSRWLGPFLVAASWWLEACNCAGGLASQCQSSTECSPALVCLEIGACALKCTQDADCTAAERCSASGGCVPKTGCGARVDCLSGQACTGAGVCAQSCQGAGSCGNNGVCLQSGTCSPKCTGVSDCPAMQKCSTVGACVPNGGCGAKEDCGPGQLCDSVGHCINDCHQTGCAAGASCGADGKCSQNAGNGDGGADAGSCGGQLFQATKVNSNMLIAFDKSGSMADPLGGTPKWDIATAAIKRVTAQYEAQIQFGLMLFPAGADAGLRCIPAPVSVNVGPLNAGRIATALNATGPAGSTPIGGVLMAAGNVPELVDPNRANYVMLVTDGAETCRGDGVQAAATNLSSKGIKTFVVGFGGEVDANNLSAMATAGGTPRPGTRKYYQADDAPGLLAAFNLIAQGALGCEYRLAMAPPEPAKVFVYVNGVLQTRDPHHANGWDYSPATTRITFYGGLCSLVATDASAKVSIVYGCPDDTLVEVDRRDGGAGLPNGSNCSAHGDCANNVCAAGTCGLTEGSSCSTSAQCASLVCELGKCQSGFN